jgi:DNA-binding LacI/PurR family transcriptional regulator
MTGRRKVIALMMGNAGLRNDYQGLLRAGVERRCAAADIDLWVYAGRSDWRPCGPGQGRIFDLVAAGRVDGIILAAGCISSFQSLEDLLTRLRQSCDAPVCAVGYRVASVASFTVDNRSGTAEVVSHLARHHQRKHFAFIAGPRDHEESEERLSATRSALAREGLELGVEAIAHGNFSQESGLLAMRKTLESLGGFSRPSPACEPSARRPDFTVA